MSQENIIRAWKDEEFRNNLSEKEWEVLPEHPAGPIELTDKDLGAVAGGLPPVGTVVECGCTHHCQ